MFTPFNEFIVKLIVKMERYLNLFKCVAIMLQLILIFNKISCLVWFGPVWLPVISNHCPTVDQVDIIPLARIRTLVLENVKCLFFHLNLPKSKIIMNLNQSQKLWRQIKCSFNWQENDWCRLVDFLHWQNIRLFVKDKIV